MRRFPTLLFLGIALFAPATLFAASGFEPLTSITSVPGAAPDTAVGFTAFLNVLYKITIGAAAVIAVFQILRAGLIYMMGDSITEKREAKHLIVMSIVGLVLVLSPYIVFSIIDPRILDMKLDIKSKLGSVPGDGSGTDTGIPGRGDDADSNSTTVGDDTSSDGGNGEGDDGNGGTAEPPAPPPVDPSKIVAGSAKYTFKAGDAGQSYYTTIYKEYKEAWGCYDLYRIEYAAEPENASEDICKRHIVNGVMGKCLPANTAPVSGTVAGVCIENGKPHGIYYEKGPLKCTTSICSGN